MMFNRKHLAAVRAAVLLVPLVLSACTVQGTDEQQAVASEVAAEEVKGAWAPASLSEVKGVPIATLRHRHPAAARGKAAGNGG